MTRFPACAGAATNCDHHWAVHWKLAAGPDPGSAAGNAACTPHGREFAVVDRLGSAGPGASGRRFHRGLRGPAESKTAVSSAGDFFAGILQVALLLCITLGVFMTILGIVLQHRNPRRRASGCLFHSPRRSGACCCGCRTATSRRRVSRNSSMPVQGTMCRRESMKSHITLGAAPTPRPGGDAVPGRP